jgi:putative ABC transport system permease protein
MLKSHIKITLRNLKRQKAYSIINIGGLAIGMACFILILLWVQDELGFDQFHKNKNELYRVIIGTESKSGIGTCGALVPTLQAEIPEIQKSVRLWNGWPSLIHYNEKKVKKLGRFADPSVLEIFTFPLISGNPQTALKDKHSIILTESVAKMLFHKENPMGKTVHIPNRWGEKEIFTISGVIQDVPRNSHIQFDFLFSFNLLQEWYRPDFSGSWRNHSFIAYLLIDKNTHIADLNTKITACYNRHAKRRRKLYLQPLSEIYTDPVVTNQLGPQGNMNTIHIFITIAAFVMLIACINFMNLATARSIKRARDVGLHKVIGANKRHIILHYLGEAFFLAIIALPLAILLLELVIPYFNELIDKKLALNYLDSSFLPAVLGITTITGLLAGSYPALYLSRFQPIHCLKNKALSGGRSHIFRKALVVFQFALSIAIISITIIVSQQMRFFQEKDLGFDKSNMIYTWTSGYKNDAIRNELLKNPGILNVAGSGAQLDFIGWGSSIKDWQGRNNRESVSTGILEVGYEYLNTYKLKMVDGRFYAKTFPSDKSDAIVLNEAAIKAMQMERPIGKKITLQGKTKKIIGILKDFHFQSLHSPITPIAFVIYPKKLPCLGIRIKPESRVETVTYIKTVLAKFLPDEILEYKFLDEQLEGLYTNEHNIENIFRYFSFIAVFIACLGLLGLAFFSTEQRTKEIGIRKVLGASVSDIVTLLSRDFVKLVLLANLFAWPLSWYAMNRWLQHFAYRINIDWWAFIQAGMLALVIALAMVSFQAIKVAFANPIGALRYE